MEMMHSSIGVHREGFKKIYKMEDFFDTDERLSQVWQKISLKVEVWLDGPSCFFLFDVEIWLQVDIEFCLIYISDFNHLIRIFMFLKTHMVPVGKVNLAHEKFTIERNDDTSKVRWSCYCNHIWFILLTMFILCKVALAHVNCCSTIKRHLC